MSSIEFSDEEREELEEKIEEVSLNVHRRIDPIGALFRELYPS